MSTYKIEARKDISCQAGKMALPVIEAAISAKEEPAFRTVIGKETKGGKFPLYVDTAESEKMFAKIVSVTDEAGSALDADDIVSLTDMPYTAVWRELNENTIKGILVIDEEANTKAAAGLSDNEVEAAMEAAIASGVISRDGARERIAYMAENEIDPPLTLRVIKGWKKYGKPGHRPSCLYQDPYLEESKAKGNESIVAEGLRAAVTRQPIICEGEKSVGKNVYIETIAWLMLMPMYLITFSRQMSPSSIYGEKATDNSASEALASSEGFRLAKSHVALSQAAAQGEAAPELEDDAAKFEVLKARSASVNIIIDQSELYDWLTDGGIMVFNEMNMGEANFMASFANQLTDGTGFLFIPGRGEVPINRDCVLFGTQNADYTGVEEQNEATLSRFGCINFKQPRTVKAQLIAATNSGLAKNGYTGKKLERKYFSQAETFYQYCQKAAERGQITNAALNIRGLVRALIATTESEGYAKLSRQIEIHVVNTCQTDERAELVTALEKYVTV